MMQLVKSIQLCSDEPELNKKARDVLFTKVVFSK